MQSTTKGGCFNFRQTAVKLLSKDSGKFLCAFLPNCNAEVNGCVLIEPSVLWVPGGSLCTKAILPVLQLASWYTILLS